MALLIEGADRPATQSRVTHRRPSPTQPDSEKNADEELGNRQSEKARYLDDEGEPRRMAGTISRERCEDYRAGRI